MVEAMRGLYVSERGRLRGRGGDWAGDVCGGERRLLVTYEWAVVTSESGTFEGGVGGSGESGDEPVSPVSEDGGVMDAIEANMAAVLVGVAGIGVEPSLQRCREEFISFMIPESPDGPPQGLGLAIPLAGGLIRFSFCRLQQSNSIN